MNPVEPLAEWERLLLGELDASLSQWTMHDFAMESNVTVVNTSGTQWTGIVYNLQPSFIGVHWRDEYGMWISAKIPFKDIAEVW